MNSAKSLTQSFKYQIIRLQKYRDEASFYFINLVALNPALHRVLKVTPAVSSHSRRFYREPNLSL